MSRRTSGRRWPSAWAVGFDAEVSTHEQTTTRGIPSYERHGARFTVVFDRRCSRIDLCNDASVAIRLHADDQRAGAIRRGKREDDAATRQERSGHDASAFV